MVLESFASLLSMINPGSGANKGMKMLSGFDTKSMGTLVADAIAYISLSTAGEIAGANMQPEVMIGHLPLYAVDKIEVAKSDRELRFRSVGGQFLAYQEGDNVAIKIDATLNGPLRLMWLTMLDMLYIRGIPTKETKKYSDLGNFDDYKDVMAMFGSNNFGTMTPGGYFLPTLVGNDIVKTVPGDAVPSPYDNSQIVTLNNDHVTTTSGGKADVVNDDFRSAGEYKETGVGDDYYTDIVHKTFNLITEEEVFSNVYIESFFWSRDVWHNGKDSMTIHLLCRRFIDPPTRFTFTISCNPVKTKGISITKSSMKYVRPLNTFAEQEKIEEADKFMDENVFFTDRRGMEYSISKNNLKKDGYKDLRNAMYAKRLVGWSNTKILSKYGMVTSTEAEDNYYKSSVSATKKEFEDSLTTSEVKIPYYDSDNPSIRKFVGVSWQGDKPGDFKLLAFNILWRGAWIAQKMTLSLIMLGNSKVGSDPIVGRVIMIANAAARMNAAMTAQELTEKNDSTISSILNLGGKSGFATTLSAQRASEIVTGTTKEFANNTPFVIDTDSDEMLHVKEVFEQLGFTIDSDHCMLSDFFYEPSRQKYLRMVFSNGFTITKLHGDRAVIGDTIVFGEKIVLAFASTVTVTSGMTNLKVFMDMGNDGTCIEVRSGCTYYLGDGTVPEWSKNEQGYMKLDKHVEDEAYIYIQDVVYTNDRCCILAWLMMPAWGM